ncbi:hypothetical protein PYW07_001665 [Mythimna separata]|uniref:Uncharacterized protein n=1 Tax=Mythimna separata TaxID=271217 RepID=A0AAD7YTK1_MYTSE|nr:hypothetical protein PYW07_001665 [Mythimna separata]
MSEYPTDVIKMARLNHIVLGILILHINVYAAPNDVSKLEEIAKVVQADQIAEQSDPIVELSVPIVEPSDPKLEQPDPKAEESDPKLDSEPKEGESDSDSDETKREKRWYNPYAYGLPPFNPFYNPGFDKRDEGSNTGYYGEDPLAQIHRRVQEIAHFVRQPQPQPPPPHFPIFYPVLFIPPFDCNCNNENPNTTTSEPDTAVTPPNRNGDGNNTDNNGTDDTTPTVVSRWPAMEDERQNWGIVVNENDSEEGVDFTRPISFDPIKLNRPGARPAPPVEHGTVQSDTDSQNRPQSEAPVAQTPPTRPQSQPQPQPQPATTRRPSQSFNRPQNSQPPRSPASGLAPPSRCDGAILTCCHQPQVTYDCFAIQGCSDLSGYGSPCAPSQIVRVIERFQMYYGQRYNN